MSLLLGQAEAAQSDMASRIYLPRRGLIMMEQTSAFRFTAGWNFPAAQITLNWANTSPREEVLRTGEGTE